MKILLREDRIIDIMKLYLQDRFPTLLTPLKPIRWEDERAWRSRTGRSLPMIHSTKYRDANGDDWVIEFRDEDNTDTKFAVDSALEPFFQLFGLEYFQKFFLDVHGIDLSQSHGKKYDWLFR